MSDENMKDLLGELLMGDEDDETNDDGIRNLPSTADVNALKAQIEDLNKEKLGLLTATKEERRKRQAANERMLKIEGAIDNMLSQRQQQGMESLSYKESAEAQRKGLPVVYDEDGNGWIDPSAQSQWEQDLLTPYQQKILDLERRIQLTDSKHSASDEAERIKQSIIGEDEQYGRASGTYRAARKWVEDAVLDYARSNGVDRPIQSGEALDYVFDRQLRREFEEEFGDIDIVDIVTAEDSKEHFRRMLRNVSRKLTPEDSYDGMPKERMDSRFQKVMNKPSALGSQANAKAGELSIYDKIGRLGSVDIMALDEKTIEALLNAAGKE